MNDALKRLDPIFGMLLHVAGWETGNHFVGLPRLGKHTPANSIKNDGLGALRARVNA